MPVPREEFRYLTGRSQQRSKGTITKRLRFADKALDDAVGQGNSAVGRLGDKLLQGYLALTPNPRRHRRRSQTLPRRGRFNGIQGCLQQAMTDQEGVVLSDPPTLTISRRNPERADLPDE